MVQYWLNWRTAFAFAAISIVSGTIIYSQYVSHKIAADERHKVGLWIEAQKTLLTPSDSASVNLASKISAENTDIPIIETDEEDHISGNYLNLDSSRVKSDTAYLQGRLTEFKRQNRPIELVLSEHPFTANRYYYGESLLLKEVRYYPLIQLFIVALFIIVVFIAQRAAYQGTQNQVWAGMAKETAHQLGTPVTSLQGWVEMLKEIPGAGNIVPEIEKDVSRLLLVTDRFGKIGSKPSLEERNIVDQVRPMMDYMKKRAGVHIDFSLVVNETQNMQAWISPPLFDWVIENLLKNALDAMQGKGKVTVTLQADETEFIIDVADTGKGISKKDQAKIFRPGFTTKRRGWGLGLTLARRIIEQYHRGSLFIRYSEPGKGTSFRIVIYK